MKRIGWGRRLRAALKAEGYTRANKAEIVDGLRACAAEMGAQAAATLWEHTHNRTDIPQSVRDSVSLDVSTEVDNAIRSIMREWKIPRSAETERMAAAAETAFRDRLASLTSAGSAA